MRGAPLVAALEHAPARCAASTAVRLATCANRAAKSRLLALSACLRCRACLALAHSVPLTSFLHIGCACVALQSGRGSACALNNMPLCAAWRLLFYHFSICRLLGLLGPRTVFFAACSTWRPADKLWLMPQASRGLPAGALDSRYAALFCDTRKQLGGLANNMAGNAAAAAEVEGERRMLRRTGSNRGLAGRGRRKQHLGCISRRR